PQTAGPPPRDVLRLALSLYARLARWRPSPTTCCSSHSLYTLASHGGAPAPRRAAARTTAPPGCRGQDGAVPSLGVKLVPSGTLMARIALALLLLLAGGCAWDGPMSSVASASDFSRAILHVYAIITWATAIIGLIVFVALAYILVRFRARPDAPPPAQVRGHTLLELGWTIGPALVLLLIAIPTIQVIFRTQTMASPAGALQVTVRGWQWWWEFRYPDLGVVTANALHLPVGRTVVLHLEGPDVIHSFWVPHLGGKRDVVPGRNNRIVLTP